MPRPPDTRTRILRAATRQFQANGYQHTTLQAIAADLGLTKATILYHFPTKAHLAAELLEPFVVRLETATEHAAAQPEGQRAWAMIEGWLDALLAHRRMLGMLLYDLALLSRQSQYSRLLAVSGRAIQAVAGPNPSQRDRVRATQSIAMLGDPILFQTDADRASLRADILDGVRRLMRSDEPGHTTVTESEPAPGIDSPTDTEAAERDRPTAHRTVPTRRGRGRPAVVSAEQASAARALYAAGERSVDQLAEDLGVSRATLYRHLRGSL